MVQPLTTTVAARFDAVKARSHLQSERRDRYQLWPTAPRRARATTPE